MLATLHLLATQTAKKTRKNLCDSYRITVVSTDSCWSCVEKLAKYFKGFTLTIEKYTVEAALLPVFDISIDARLLTREHNKSQCRVWLESSDDDSFSACMCS